MQDPLSEWLWLEDFTWVWPTLYRDCPTICLLSNLLPSPSPAPVQSAPQSSQPHSLYSPKQLSWSILNPKGRKSSYAHLRAMPGVQMCNALTGEWNMGANCSFYHSNKMKALFFLKKGNYKKVICRQNPKITPRFPPQHHPLPLSIFETFGYDGISFPWLGCQSVDFELIKREIIPPSMGLT